MVSRKKMVPKKFFVIIGVGGLDIDPQSIFLMNFFKKSSLNVYLGCVLWNGKDC
jgi:hypothetical protein